MPDIRVTSRACAELELNNIWRRVGVAINGHVVRSVVRYPKERDTDKDRICFIRCRLNGKRMGHIVRIELAHGLIVVHRDTSHSALHCIEEIVVQARCTIVLLDDNSDNAVRRQFQAGTWAISHPPNLRVGRIGVTYHAVGERREIEGRAVRAVLVACSAAGFVAKALC